MLLQHKACLIRGLISLSCLEHIRSFSHSYEKFLHTFHLAPRVLQALAEQVI